MIGSATLLRHWLVVLMTMTLWVPFAQAQPASESPCPPTPEAQHDEAELLRALVECRLAIAYDVAQAKYNSGAPVEDKEREEAVVAAAAEQAALYGLPASSARAFWRAQIEASKQVQSLLIKRWTADAHPAFLDAPDLTADVRPKLDMLTEQLTIAYATLYFSQEDISAACPVRKEGAEHHARGDAAVLRAALRTRDYGEALKTAFKPLCG